jgi:hypothetical protein
VSWEVEKQRLNHIINEWIDRVMEVKMNQWLTDLANVTVFTLLLRVFEGGHTSSSIHGRHFVTYLLTDPTEQRWWLMNEIEEEEEDLDQKPRGEREWER